MYSGVFSVLMIALGALPVCVCICKLDCVCLCNQELFVESEPRFLEPGHNLASMLHQTLRNYLVFHHILAKSRYFLKCADELLTKRIDKV